MAFGFTSNEVPLSHFSQILSIPRSRGFDIGDPHTIRGEQHHHRLSVWVVESRPTVADNNLEPHVEYITHLLITSQSQIAQVRDSMSVTAFARLDIATEHDYGGVSIQSGSLAKLLQFCDRVDIAFWGNETPSDPLIEKIA